MQAYTHAMNIRKEEGHVREYYETLFRAYSNNDLFEVYDVEREEFVQFTGRQGSEVINKQTLIENLIELALGGETVEPYIIIEYNPKDTDFNYPAFVGLNDGYKNI